MSMTRLRATIGALAMAATLLFAPGVGLASTTQAHAVTKLSHADAAARFRASGITWSSSGGCSDRNNPTCTSFEQINLATVQGAQTLRSASGCALNITGGTEAGHAGGTYSHWNGYKLDFSPYSCLSGYITGNFTYIGPRPGDGAAQYRSGAGNIYARESNHWDVLFYNCGGC
ncbi:hypothetical protein [Wenjunlia tyrosinilytica]|uniref:Uncharacterized protein n=1 Tax=Wenjunlia tyrosinilytica TaxID=1544741 RepID=A0A917ZTK9_9ACTN|nr:hypothetical protein [Wenjunlia tyrosinilytica]GGO93052.1 hypothetical protein GCM10012280_44660 [Wenjunlia tyrosinilytica]